MDLDAYRADAEHFVSELDREYYLHFSGQQDAYEVERIYADHERLFTREAAEELRSDPSDTRLLLEFAVQGLIGRETSAEQAELARRESETELEVDGERLPYRSAGVAQANERDPERRQALEQARNAAVEEQLNPILLELLERSHAIAAELGWPSMRALCEELSGIDLGALAQQTEAFIRATDDSYRDVLQPQLETQLGFGFERLRRADLAAFFRAPSLDARFQADRLVPSLTETLAGLGIDIQSQEGVALDTEPRPKKSPRAFCAPVRAPGEVYLVIAPIGGRDDFAALFHEAGHTEHYAHVDPGLSVEERLFGDNSVTEGFAFLMEQLVSRPAWLERRLGIDDPEEVLAHSRAVKLLFMRRYCAKLAYELELHGGNGSPDGMRELYARRLSEAVGVDWPSVAWLNDVDPFFYAARYLRAWALETHLRRLLSERFGEAWFDEPGAGELLRGIWRRGQAQDAGELLAQLSGAELDFSALEAELVG
jgi:hypothetical protein